jgi:tetratricopeptide (TPR) repeat protein
LPNRIEEMLAWARVAVALRPDRPFAHNLLSRAWGAMRNWDEAEASARRAIELSRNWPKYTGAQVSLANVLSDKGDLDGAEANYLASLAIDPDAYGIYHNLGVVCIRRGDLVGAEEWLRKLVAAVREWDIQRDYYRQLLVQIGQQRERLDEVVAGRSDPANPDEAFRAIRQALHPSRQQYSRSVKLYTWAFAANPALADDLASRRRYDAARCAALAAAGKDKELPKVETAEWGHLTGLAMKWLQADLTLMTTQAKGPKRQGQVGEWLTHWKKDPDLASVRDPAALAAMTPPNRPAWEALWREVDTLLAAGWVLSIGGVVRVDGENRDIAAASDLPRERFTLTTVSLADRPVTDADLANVKGLQGLHALNLRGTGVTDAGLVHLKGLTSLHLLILTNTAVMGEGLADLKDLTGLNELWLKDTRLTDPALAHLKNLTGLRWLTLAGTEVTDAGLIHLEDCKELVEVGLDATRVTDAGLVYLKGLENLRKVWLQETAVTDAGLAHLKSLTALTHLNLGKTQVTAKGVAELHAAVPGCMIEWDGGTGEPKK